MTGSLDQLRGHQLLPQEIKNQLPALYSQDGLGLEALALVKFFTPRSNWTWYASEGSPVDANGYYDTNEEKVDYLLFGLIVGMETELGYFSLTELETVTDRYSLPAVERDLYFKAKKLSELKQQHER